MISKIGFWACASCAALNAGAAALSMIKGNSALAVACVAGCVFALMLAAVWRALGDL